MQDALTNCNKKITDLMNRLLDPESGCPWDIKQTPKSLSDNLLEETYELLEAIDQDDPEAIQEETGDVYFLLHFISILCHKKFGFTLADSIEQNVAKMTHRHPHIFENQNITDDVEAVLNQWQKIKRKDRPKMGLLDSVPIHLPALQKAQRLSERAARAGFDWDNIAEVDKKVDEELCELTEAREEKSQAAIKHELGDVFFSLVSLARHLGISAEDALREANNRFISRIRYIEEKLAKESKIMENESKEHLEELWIEAKKALSTQKTV